MEIILICIAVTTIVLSTSSYIHRSRQQAFLKKTLKVDDSLRERVARKLGVDGAVVTGVSTFDVLYNTMKLDPDALEGMKHLHHAQGFDNLGDLMDFMKSKIIKSEPGSEAWDRMIDKYKGYTAEEKVADSYREQGRDVETPKSGTNEGWDHKIDGTPHNTKLTTDKEYIQKHLDKHPDSYVDTNRDIGDAFSDNPRVVSHPFYETEVKQSTADTFEGIKDLGDGIDSVPFVSLAINACKNIHKLHKGDIDLKTAAEHTALDATASGVGGWLGGTAGLGWGLALAPVTGGLSAVVLPVLGSLVGIFTGKGISGWFKERHLRRAIEEIQYLTTEFRDSFLDLYQTVVGAMDSYFESHLITCGSGRREEGFLKRIVFPSVKTTFYRMASRELKTERTASHSFYSDLREAVQDVEEPSEGGMILFANCQQRGVDMLYEIDPLPEYYAAIEAQLEIIEAEQRKLR